MNNRTRVALVAAAIVIAQASAAGAATASHGSTPVAQPAPDPTPRNAGLEHGDDTVAPTVARAEAVAVPTKQASAALPGSEAFVLLGMGVVLVGVLARQRRGFRRSGTILLR